MKPNRYLCQPGKRPLTIVDVAAADTGGQSYRISRAINRYTPHESRSFVRDLDYIRFPYDVLHAERDPQWVAEYWGRADVIHVHGHYRAANGWATPKPGVKWLYHQHGRHGGAARAALQAADAARGALRVVSTLNLLEHVDDDESRWIPAPLDLMLYDELRRRWGPPHDSVIRVAHSPTRRDYKGTDHLLAVVAGLRADGLAIEVKLIEHVTHVECLRLRAMCDITFDQIHLSLGSSGLEGMAFRQPTLVGCPERVRDTFRRVVGKEPYIYVDHDSLGPTLAELATNARMRRKVGQLGRSYVERWHAEPAVAARVAGLYERLCG